MKVISVSLVLSLFDWKIRVKIQPKVIFWIKNIQNICIYKFWHLTVVINSLIIFGQSIPQATVSSCVYCSMMKHAGLLRICWLVCEQVRMWKKSKCDIVRWICKWLLNDSHTILHGRCVSRDSATRSLWRTPPMMTLCCVSIYIHRGIGNVNVCELWMRFIKQFD